MKKNIFSKSFMLFFGTLFLGCTQNNTIGLYPKHKSLSQERLFLIDKPFANSHTQSKSIGFFKSAILDVIAPQLVDNMIDVVGKSIVELSGKNSQTKTKSARITNYFYEDADYKIGKDTSAYHMVFVSAEFGEEQEVWRPANFDTRLHRDFQALNLVGKPKFYMEVSIFPIPNTQYMEVMPTYLFYNRHFNNQGIDQKRDLELRFSFSEIGANDTTFSSGTIVLQDVKVGEEYGVKELAGVKTDYLMMPQISPSKQGKSGGYTLRIDVTETRDINEWLATLGESIIQSKTEIAHKLYVTDEDKILRDTAIQKAKIEVKKVELKLEELKASGASELEKLELESQLLDKKAEVNKLSIQYGKAKIY
jgi:hypothetical protein